MRQTERKKNQGRGMNHSVTMCGGLRGVGTSRLGVGGLQSINHHSCL